MARSLRYQSAFTLVELMVVLVIVGLLVTLIMQGFAYSLGVYQRVITTQRNAYAQVMAADWFRSTLSVQVAPRPKDKGLEGTATELSTYTYQPLFGEVGLKTRIQWQLTQNQDQLVLSYQESGRQVQVQRWSGSSGAFEYLSPKGRWASAWNDSARLPRAVRIVIRAGSEVRNTLVSINTRQAVDLTLESAYGDN